MELLRKNVSGIILVLFLVGVLMLPFRVQPVIVGSKTNIPNFDLNVDNTATTQQTAQLILETDKHVYLLGENVTIILKNVGDRRVGIGGYPAWQIFTYPEEEPVYPAIFSTLAWSLEPGENDTFVWNQYNQFNESFCSPGTYVVKDTQGWGLSAYFEIISANIIVPDDYPSIRQAVFAANPGDTVYVRAGIYYEKEVTVTKPVTIFGEHRNFTIIDGNGSWVCVYVKSTHHVRLSEFTIQNGYGVYLYNSHNVIISENIISNNGQGVILIGSHNNTICQNTVAFNGLSILLSEGSSHNIISKNLVTMNRGDGIWLDHSFENLVRENIVSKNGLGTAPGYHVYGIRLSYSNNNAIYHNLIMNNYEQADGWMSINNTWDNGYPSGGNYWSDYIGVDLYSGPYQNETGSDGIGDTPYIIDENNRDNYPLMKPWTPTPPVVTATVDINPHTLNLRSKGKWITCYIELPEGYNVADINVSSIMLNNSIPAEPKPIATGNYDSDGVPDLMVKFNRAEVISYILSNVNIAELIEERFMTITLTVTGYLNDGTPFQGSTTIKIALPMPRGIYRIFPI